MDRIQKRLNSGTSKLSVNTDTHLKINIEGKERLLPPDEINSVINSGDRFNLERQRSNFYRVFGTINPSITNALFNLDDALNADLYTWKGFNYRDPISDISRFFEDFYSVAINKNLKELDGWFGYYDPNISNSGLCNFYEMEPKSSRFSFINDSNPFNGPVTEPIKNWGLTITYPHSVDSGHTIVNGGLMIIEKVDVEVATRAMTAFGLPCLHNLSIGDTVLISGTNGYDGEHVVVRTGLDNGDLKPYYFVIDLPPIGSLSNNSRIKRVFDGVESQYYFRLFKKVKTRSSEIIQKDDYETYKLSFSENIFNDDITQFVFNEDVDITDLKDNLGRPLSELYLTTVKTDSNGLFTNVSAGIETPFMANLNTSNAFNTYLLDVPAINKIHNGGSLPTSLPFPSHSPLSNNVSIDDELFYGDLVEYNNREVREVILADVSHRFNTVNRESSPTVNYLYRPNTTITKTINLGPRQEGYFYKAHNLIKIRQFSSYIEQGDNFTVGIPDYAVKIDEERYLWRDLLDIGFNQNDTRPLDYPFLNGCHYMYDNYCFSVRRQDPFNNWGLYYSTFPADPLGVRMTDNFTTNSAEDVC